MREIVDTLRRRVVFCTRIPFAIGISDRIPIRTKCNADICNHNVAHHKLCSIQHGRLVPTTRITNAGRRIDCNLVTNLHATQSVTLRVPPNPLQD